MASIGTFLNLALWLSTPMLLQEGLYCLFYIKLGVYLIFFFPLKTVIFLVRSLYYNIFFLSILRCIVTNRVIYKFIFFWVGFVTLLVRYLCIIVSKRKRKLFQRTIPNRPQNSLKVSIQLNGKKKEEEEEEKRKL